MTEKKPTRLQKILNHMKEIRPGFWQCRGHITLPGESTSHSLYAASCDKQAVEDSIQKQYNDIISGKNLPENITLQELSERYFKNKKCEPKTKRTQESIYKNHIKPHFNNGTIKIKDIAGLACDRWTDKLLAKGLSKNTVFITCVGVFSSMFTYARKKRLIDFNPLEKMSKQMEHDTRQPVGETDLVEWLTCAKDYNQTYYICALLILDTGARINEITALRWSDIDFHNQSVSITKQFDDVADNTEKHVKNHMQRVNPITTQELIELLDKRKKDTGAKENDFIFQSPKVFHYPMKEKALEGGFRRISKACGIKITPHLLRHNAGEKVAAAMSGNAWHAMHFLGHKRLSTTMGYLGIKEFTDNTNLREAIAEGKKKVAVMGNAI